MNVNRMTRSLPGKAAEVAVRMTELYGENPVYRQIVEKISERVGMTLRQITSPDE